MLDDPVLLEYLVEDSQRATPIHHVVFGDNLEPADDELALQYVRIVRYPKPDADPKLRPAIKAIRRHKRPPEQEWLARLNSLTSHLLAMRTKAAWNRP